MSIFSKAVLAATIAVAITSPVFAADSDLKIGTDLTYPPYNYFDEDQKPAGFDVELMNAIAEKAELSPTFMDTRFENLILGVNGNQFDIIASTLYVKPERAKKIDYIPYMKTGVSIAVSKVSGKQFTSPDELCGSVVGSIKGAAWLEKFEELNKGICKDSPIDSREFPTSPEATQALLSGGVDAQVEDSAVLANTASKLKGRLVISSTEQFYPVIVGLGIKQGNKELAAIINTALDALKADGSYEALLAKYNVDMPTAEEFAAAIGQ